tara:strand:+ start:1361 stop:1675 length:315 start_codon:yes stop_codon:yes gene_type:complete
MGVQKYTQMIDNNGQTVSVELGRVNRFLGEGWTTLDQPKPEKKSPRRGSKNKITAEAHVTSNVVEEATVEEEVHVHDENCDHELDQMITEADALENNEMSTKEN